MADSQAAQACKLAGWKWAREVRATKIDSVETDWQRTVSRFSWGRLDHAGSEWQLKFLRDLITLGQQSLGYCRLH